MIELQTITLSSNPSLPTLIANAGDPATLFSNTSLTQTVSISSAASFGFGNSQAISLGPGGFLVIAPQTDLYAAAPGIGVQLDIIPGGQSFFQFLEILVKTLFIEAGMGNGLYVYNPTPGTGNLIASIVAAAGFDNFGNPVVPVIAVYGPTPLGGTQSYIQMAFNGPSAFPTFGFASGGSSEVNIAELDINLVNPNTPNEVISFNIFGPRSSSSSDDRVGIQLLDSTVAAPGIATGYLFYQGSSYQNDTAAWGTAGFGILLGSKMQAIQPGTSGATIAAETWHSLVPLLSAGYAAGGQTPEYQLELCNGNRVRLRGEIALTANQVAGAVFATMPAGYIPIKNQVLPMTPNNMAGNSFNNGNVEAFTTGSLAFGSSGNNGNSFWLDGLTYVLD